MPPLPRRMRQSERRKTVPIHYELPTRSVEESDRLTAIFNIYHEHFGENAVHLPITCSKFLETKEQVYQRKYKATSEWKPLDLGWFNSDTLGLIVIENYAGRGLQEVPSEEEQEAIEQRVLKVAYNDHSNEKAGFLIPRGWPFAFFTEDAGNLRIKCLRDEVEYRLTIYPK